MGDNRYSDHERKQWRDQDDGPNSTILFCSDDKGLVLGTIRLTWLKDLDFIAHDVYEFGRLATILGIGEEELRNGAARFDRVAISPEKRRSRIFTDLWKRTIKMLLESDSVCLVGASNDANGLQTKLWKKLGRAYHEAESHGFNATIYYLDLRAGHGVAD